MTGQVGSEGTHTILSIKMITHLHLQIVWLNVFSVGIANFWFLDCERFKKVYCCLHSQS